MRNSWDRALTAQQEIANTYVRVADGAYYFASAEGLGEEFVTILVIKEEGKDPQTIALTQTQLDRFNSVVSSGPDLEYMLTSRLIEAVIKAGAVISTEA